MNKDLKSAMRKAWKEYEGNLNESGYYDINGREEDKVQRLLNKKKPSYEEPVETQTQSKE